MAEIIKTVIASDHAGVELKQFLQNNCATLEWQDLGPHSTDSVDYPDFADLACKAVLHNEATLAVLICGSGIGMSIRANRYSGIRAGLCRSENDAEMTRAHNNANVLVLSARTVSNEENLKILKRFIATEFEGGRHQRRVDKLESPTTQPNKVK